MVDTYTLINGVKQTAISYKKYEIQFQNNENKTETNVESLLTIENQKYVFENPLLFALFKEFNADINSKTNITNQLNTSFSKNIVIKVDKFGSGAPTNDVSFGFVDNSAPTNVIFLHGSLFKQVENDEVKKYALVLLEKYYNEIANDKQKPTGAEKKIIRNLCKNGVKINSGVVTGGNPTKGSIHSSLKKTRKRKIPKK